MYDSVKKKSVCTMDMGVDILLSYMFSEERNILASVKAIMIILSLTSYRGFRVKKKTPNCFEEINRIN